MYFAEQMSRVTEGGPSAHRDEPNPMDRGIDERVQPKEPGKVRIFLGNGA
jgi:hypothetical protein